MTEEQIAVALNEHDNKIGSLKYRMDEAEENIKQIHQLVTSVQLLAQKQDSMADTVNAIQSDIKEMKNEPAKKWGNATQTIISGVISAFVAALCAALFRLM